MNLITICTLLPVILVGVFSESDIQVKHDEYSYMNSSYDLQNVTEYTIINESDSTSYLTFICQDSNESNLEKMIIRYFCAPNKSLNIMTLLTDNIVSDKFIPIIGETFLKEITPRTEFKYIMYENAPVKNSTDLNLCVFVVDKAYIEKILKISITDKYLYKNDALIIS